MRLVIPEGRTLKVLGVEADEKPPQHVVLPAGIYQLEKIKNPLGGKYDWLVIERTKTGMAEEALRKEADRIGGSIN